MRTTVDPGAEVWEVLRGEQVLRGESAREWASGSGRERGAAGARGDAVAPVWQFGAPPDAVLFPESAEEVQAVVRAAIRGGVSLLPAGTGAWLSAGGWGREARAIVSTARIGGVVHYEPADLTLTAGAGLGVRALGELADRNGQWLPVDAPGSVGGTLGAAVACGVSGPLQGCYGGVRDNVLGLEVVTGDGRILHIGGRVVKNVAGYDMVRLFTGSRGSLGVITRVSVRLFPRPGADVTLCFRGGAAEVVGMAREVCTAAFPVAAAEIVGGGGVGADRPARGERGEGDAGMADGGGASDGGGTIDDGGTTDDGGMTLAVRLLGSAEEVAEAGVRAVASLDRKPDEVLAGDDSAAFHEGRTRWEDGSPVVARLAALPDRLGDVMGCAGRVSAVVRGEVAADAMRGLVRVKGSCAAGREEAVADCLVRARAEMEDWGGSLALSSAPREVVEAVGWVGAGAGGVGGRIKALFDPHSILASGCP
ncbi:MAG: FAD-binding oxidoreductase [Gemmatimonadota bacterium]|nr:FAD-binding oxidoreductase [Gemmatimonadota bacterium]